MVDFDAAACELFVNSCATKKSPEELFNMLIGVDEKGCPAFKVKIIQDQVSSLTLDSVQGSTIANLITAFATYKTAHPTRIITMQSTFWDGTNHITTFFYK